MNISHFSAGILNSVLFFHNKICLQFKYEFEPPKLKFCPVLESKAFAVSKTTIKPYPPAPSIRQILPQIGLFLQK
jgi:hypothetical protein